MLRLLMTPTVLFPTRDFERERKSVCVRVCVSVWIQPRKDKNNRGGNHKACEFAMKHAVNRKFCLNSEYFIYRCTWKKEDRISKSDELWYLSKVSFVPRYICFIFWIFSIF